MRRPVERSLVSAGVFIATCVVGGFLVPTTPRWLPGFPGRPWWLPFASACVFGTAAAFGWLVWRTWPSLVRRVRRTPGGPGSNGAVSAQPASNTGRGTLFRVGVVFAACLAAALVLVLGSWSRIAEEYSLGLAMSEDRDSRLRGFEQIGAMQSVRGIELLVRATRSTCLETGGSHSRGVVWNDTDSRIAAIRALGQFRSVPEDAKREMEEARAALERALSEPDPRIAEAASEALASLSARRGG
jgi:hypothetical protein